MQFHGATAFRRVFAGRDVTWLPTAPAQWEGDGTPGANAGTTYHEILRGEIS
jgi:hypothetical protein